MMERVSAHAFRFGVIAAATGGGQEWRATVRRIAELGYTSVLMPDVVRLLAPGPALAIAASVADIRVGTWVYAAPLRAPGITAWEAHSLSMLTGDRFEMGIGAGRPGMEAELAQLDLPFGSPAERLARVSRTIDALRDLDGPNHHTPVLVATGGPRSRALAAVKADMVTFATGPLTPRGEVAAMSADLRARAGSRAADIELVANLVAVGEELPADIERMTGVDAATLRASDSLSVLRGGTRAMVDELQRRRDEVGTSYIAVNVAFMHALAPAVEALTGT
jgi:alkanesulfonate monooxygenase SsuD/methylene tetrahydromethanopterin reductase-like flavin-dependent oxidoreductase (luciferase family)